MEKTPPPQEGSKPPAEKPFSVAAPGLSLPKGGGAIRGIGEKFAANPVTGTGSMSVPIATSPGRAGFGPQLALAYDSGAGNGPFGLGWHLSLPAITRKTDKGLPKYQDADESDVFLLSGTEDLVPVFEQDANGDWISDPQGRFKVHERDRVVDGKTYRVRRYRPRIEGLFARIERWTNPADASDVWWRSITRDNIVTFYGLPFKKPDGTLEANHSRIVDPQNPSHIFSWLISQTHDDKGNAMRYEHVPEDSRRVEISSWASERNRGARSANRYPKRISYGNVTSTLAAGQPLSPLGPDLSRMSWLFDVVFDYDDGHYQSTSALGADPQLVNALLGPSAVWPSRPDSFSSYRAGFEVRTHRLCRRVLMFHHFKDQLGVDDYLVRSTEFNYQADPGGSFLNSVIQSGYVWQAGAYRKQSLPLVEFTYTKAEISSEIREVDPTSLENLPVGLDGSAYQWVDLDGEGLSGILAEQGGAWYYKRNLSALPQLTAAGASETRARFAPVECVARLPASAAGAGRRHQFLDLAGDGSIDVVEFGGPSPGFYERTDAGSWAPFTPFRSLPNLAWDDPNQRFIDLTGDGHADILITEDNVFTYHASLAEDGFDRAEKIYQSFDDELGPRLLLADATVSIAVADMSGDGLADLVRIRNGEVCYWPNLGYGRFGAKVTLDNSPWFDAPDQFDPKRLRLADIDGSGTTDLIYLGRNRTAIYHNLAGNRLAGAEPLELFPAADNHTAVQVCDLLGNGTACLVWSSPLPGDTGRQMRYIDLMGGQKPHLLVKCTNNLGAETNIRYAPSTKFYLADKLAGRPWITRLSFPVHVVERVETTDHVSRNRFTTRYAYHHGYFDGVEREFRGFGMVEQWDTDELGSLTPEGVPPDAINIDASSYVPPVHTKTWFHTGVFIDRGQVSDFFAGLLPGGGPGEYYREEGLTADQARDRLLSDTVFPGGLTADEEREACRALKGSLLRRETYADDGSESEDRPYSVTEQNFTIELLQPGAGQRQAVFLVHPREQIDHHYERKLYPVNGTTIVAPGPGVPRQADPRRTHAITLEADAFGNVLKSVSIGYGRKLTDPALPLPADQARQLTPLVTYTENTFTNSFDEDDFHRTPLPGETVTDELTGYQSTGPAGRFQAADFVKSDPVHPEKLVQIQDVKLNYEEAPGAGRQRRAIEHLRTLYRKDDLTGPLPPNTCESFALPYESYKLAFTPGLLDRVYQRPRQGNPAELLLPANRAAVLAVDVPGGKTADRGGYVDLDGNDHWWIPSGRTFYSPDAADDAATELAHAVKNFFLPHRYRDPFGRITTVAFDDHDLLTVETRDAIGNRVTTGERDATGAVTKPGNDYRVLQPALISDANRNRAAVAFDALGLVAGTAVMGKPEEDLGDSLAGFEPDLSQAQIDLFAQPADPRPPAVTLLKNATTRIVYDLGLFQRTQKAQPGDPAKWLPAYAATLTRETHFKDPLPSQGLQIQVNFSHSDGFGREIQKKIQAEPGPLDPNAPGAPMVNPRWVGSGWTIFNNKGKPVRKYEPFFSVTHDFEFGVKVGKSPVLFYDPLERVVATVHPNHTYEKVLFDPWGQETWDVNDTVLLDPSGDEDVLPFFLDPDGSPRLPQEDYLPTWHALRTDPALTALAHLRWPVQKQREAENAAAEKAAAHAGTPTLARLDALGRTFLTLARNKVVCHDHPLDGTTGEFATRVELDIEGNQRAVRDAIVQNGDERGRVVMEYDYDMLGHRIYQLSMEAGTRWMLHDILDKPIRAWDSRARTFRTEYDPLRRPVRSFVAGIDPADPETEFLVERQVYGEQVPDAESVNLRGKLFLHLDQSGAVTNEAHDFKGNLLAASRRIAQVYKETVDWAALDAKVPADPNKPFSDAKRKAALKLVVEPESFAMRMAYDALNRVTQLVAPHAAARCNVIQHRFNEANLLAGVDVWLNQAKDLEVPLDPSVPASSAVGIDNIDYDAKGQRQLIQYMNGAETRYRYDPDTFRLIQLYTRRGANFTEDFDNPASPPMTLAAPPIPPPGAHCGLQNLSYVYDPAGNITSIRDDALQTIYFDNQRVEPSAEYVYDAIYRLIEATGREHLGQQGGTPNDPTPSDAFDFVQTHPADPRDGTAMGNYRQHYVYDEVGNFKHLIHAGTDLAKPGWTRNYFYEEDSLTEPATAANPAKQSNRLTRTTVGGGTDKYSVNGDGYDAHGNMLKMGHLPLMQWDFKDQLQATSRQEINAGTPITTWYVYDASGLRVRKVTVDAAPPNTEPTRLKERIYLGGFELYREYDTDGATVTLERETLHVMDDKQRIALVETDTTLLPAPGSQLQSLVRYQFSNHLGSASLELDDKAKIISYEEYYPYGSTSYQAVNAAITSTAKRYRYTGKERDEESGLYYHEARYYAPWLSSWVSCDPAGIVDSLCLYRFSKSHPIRYIDLDGHQSVEGAANASNHNEAIKDIAKALLEASTEQKNAQGNVVRSFDPKLALSGLELSYDVKRLKPTHKVTKANLGHGRGAVAGGETPGSKVGDIHPVHHLEDIKLYVDEKGKPTLLEFTSKASIQNYGDLAIKNYLRKDVSETFKTQLPWRVPGVVLSIGLLNEIGGGARGGTTGVTDGLKIVPYGTVGVVDTPEHPSPVAARTAEGGPSYSAGEVTTLLGQELKVYKGPLFDPHGGNSSEEDHDKPLSTHYKFLLDTVQAGHRFGESELEPKGTERGYIEALKAKVQQRINQL